MPASPFDTASTSPPPLLEVQELRIGFPTHNGVTYAVDRVSFAVGAGETVCVVGESGCGKSLTALSLLRLVPSPGRIDASSRIAFDGADVLGLSPEALRNIRGQHMAMIFQEPMTALNPVLTVGQQIAEVLQVHTKLSRAERWTRTLDMLVQVGIADAAVRATQYPHELSGGMRQRVMIAIALIMSPKLVIADEPTTALDVTIQAQILELLRDLRTRTGMALLLITHDLGVVAEMASRVIVMYAGTVVEEASVFDLFAAPKHPYTIGLLAAIPRLGQETIRLPTIAGSVPLPTALPSGCRFRDRCPQAFARCHVEEPLLQETGPAHRVRCHLVDEPARRDASHVAAAV